MPHHKGLEIAHRKGLGIAHRKGSGSVVQGITLSPSGTDPVCSAMYRSVLSGVLSAYSVERAALVFVFSSALSYPPIVFVDNRVANACVGKNAGLQQRLPVCLHDAYPSSQGMKPHPPVALARQRGLIHPHSARQRSLVLLLLLLLLFLLLLLASKGLGIPHHKGLGRPHRKGLGKGVDMPLLAVCRHPTPALPVNALRGTARPYPACSLMPDAGLNKTLVDSVGKRRLKNAVGVTHERVDSSAPPVYLPV